MSLIETALQKLRRAGDTDPAAAPQELRRSAADRRTPVMTTSAAIEIVRQEPAKRLAVDMKALREAGYLPQEGLEARFANHYRQIKRPLIEKAASGGPEMHLIGVTSALPGDGKTFTSINLALSMARERDVSVLLVDADVARARVSQLFGIRAQLGLLDALTDESLDVESLIERTDVRGLEVLSTGRFVENATELLVSARMSQVAARIASRNPRRLVVFDTAPLLVSSEARVMLRILGQIVLVARTGVTPRQALVEALTHIDRSKLQGLILNQVPFTAGGGYYEYAAYGPAASDPSGDA